MDCNKTACGSNNRTVRRQRRRILATISVAATLFLSSCNDKTHVFTLNAPDYGNAAKTYMNNAGNSRYILHWNDGDTIKLNGQQYRVSVDANHKATVAAEDVQPIGGSYFSAFPASASMSADGSFQFEIERDAVYRTVPSGTGEGRQIVDNIMVAATEGNELNYENMCALLQFNVKASTSISIAAIEIESDKPLYGSVKATHSGTSWNTVLSGGGNMRRLVFTTPVQPSDGGQFYMLVPEVSGATSFTLRFVLQQDDGSVRVVEQTKTGSISFVRSQVVIFPEADLNNTGTGGYTDVSPSGSASSPFIIPNGAAWNYYMQTYGSNSSYHFSLTGDIVATGSTAQFCGTLNGNGYTATVADNVPLFSTVKGGKVSNLVLKGDDADNPTTFVDGVKESFGILASTADAATFDGCTNYVNIIHTGENIDYLGGLVGRATNTTTFTNCDNYGSLSANAASMGGLVGDCNGTLQNCSNHGTISSSRYQNVSMGGLAGVLSKTQTISNCHNYGTIEETSTQSASSTAYVGGLVGDGACSASRCSNSGKIVSSAQHNSSTYYIGGLFGKNVGNGKVISDSYNEADITNASHTATIGGLVGCIGNASATTSINNCYALGNYEGRTVAGLTGFLFQTSKSVQYKNCYYYGTLTSSGTKNGLCSDTVSTTLSYCYCPSAYNYALKSTWHSDGTCGKLVSSTLLEDNQLLLDMLNSHRPDGCIAWVLKNGSVVLTENSKHKTHK